MRMFRVLFIILLLVNLPVSAGTNVVLHYEPAKVELSGTIEVQTFPGPPNYESILNGDRVERGWFLRLSVPIDVVISKDDSPADVSETERNVRIMHLAFDFESSGLEKSFLAAKKEGVQVRLKGHLFHRWTGHHHSRVLMWVDKLERVAE